MASNDPHDLECSFADKMSIGRYEERTCNCFQHCIYKKTQPIMLPPPKQSYIHPFSTVPRLVQHKDVHACW